MPATTGDRIREAREAAGLDQVQLAAKVGVVDKTISKWENDRQPVRERNLRKVAEALGRSPEWLLTGVDVTAERHSPDRASVERPLPRVLRTHAVRVWLKEFELELTRAGVPEERIAEAIDLVTAPSVFRYFAGGAAREMDEERAVRAMETLARIVRMRAREQGFNVTEPST